MGFHMRPRAENSPVLAKILKLLDDPTTMIAKFPNLTFYRDPLDREWSLWATLWPSRFLCPHEPLS